jgi:diadenosine tetraphosphate (Ap4A) HIT family hydrolase
MCPFCDNCEPQLTSNQHAFAIWDATPVSPGHALIISRSHVPTIFDLTPAEYAACFELLRDVREFLSKEHATASFHVVVNCGPDANQRVGHAHIHLVPRYKGENLALTPHVWSSIR